MEVKPLYVVRFRYPQGWGVALAGEAGREEHDFYFAEGRCEGAVTGRFRAANHPRRRTDQTFRMDMQGFVETDDGALVMVDYQGYGRTFKDERRQIGGFTYRLRQVVGAAFHLAEDARYRRLNDCVCSIAGEVRSPDRASVEQGEVELVFQVSELVWAPPPD